MGKGKLATAAVILILVSVCITCGLSGLHLLYPCIYCEQSEPVCSCHLKITVYMCLRKLRVHSAQMNGMSMIKKIFLGNEGP